MPITKNVFIKGKMNKDLDERIVPNGEYRDALNVQISTSDGSDIGVMQNVLGNKLAYDSAINITGGKCIGSVADTENNKIYWFIAGTSVDAIAEYDANSKEVNPVLVSIKENNEAGFINVLKFDKSKLITGINIIDGLLFFTDNNSEPKKINIEDCKSGSTNFSTHTKFKKYDNTEYNFEEKDITVIKCPPIKAPTVEGKTTSRVTPNGGPAITQGIGNVKLSDNNGVLLEPGDTFQMYIPNKPTYIQGDKVKLNLVNTDSDGEIGVEILATVNASSFSVTSYDWTSLYSSMVYKFTVASISQNTPLTSRQYTTELVLGEVLFEKDFIRFGYRYKYKDGEYSTISPFSHPIFLPGAFEYDSSKGHNTAMTNNLRYLKITNFIDDYIPSQVKEIEILFKKDSSTNIYSVNSFIYKDIEWEKNEYEITSELIHKVLPSNQLLRSYDNVPKKAKAQEIAANRLIYGNYLQNFNIEDAGNNEINIKFKALTNSSFFKIPGEVSGKSIKSMRTYQLGVTYIDQYGRETPIQTDDTGAIKVSKSEAKNYTGITSQILTPPPAFAAYFKFFIKETSNQYHNLAMDRWYDAEDGNVWLSFPSSERNKLDEETFIILKKRHDDSSLVEDEAKYKIIDIKNEAPQELKEFKRSYGTVESNASGDNIFDNINYPKESAAFILIDKDEFDASFGDDTNLLLDSNRYLKITAPIIGSSGFYNVKSINKPGSDHSGFYKVTIDGSFSNDVGIFFPNNNNTNRTGGVQRVGVEFFQSVLENKKEFLGRFFAKIHRDSTLDANVISVNIEQEYQIADSRQFRRRLTKGHSSFAPVDDFPTPPYKYRGDNENQWRHDYKDVKNRWYMEVGTMPYQWLPENRANGSDISLLSSNPNAVPMGYKPEFSREPFKKGRDVIVMHYQGSRELQDIKSRDKNVNKIFATAITTDGSKIRFTQDPKNNVYTIKKHAYRGYRRYNPGTKGRNDTENRGTIFVLKLDRPIQDFDLTDVSGTSTFDIFNIEILEVTSGAQSFKSVNPAIWETEPKESIDLDLYYEASDSIPIAQHNVDHGLEWYNCFSFGNGVESNRIRDDFNAPTIAKGVKVSAPLAEQYKEERRKSGLIFSGIFNSTSGINRLNQFIAAENITKDLNPEYGSIQKLHTRDTDIITFCEDKVLKVLAQKDALFNADGNANVTSNAAVLGQAIPFVGEFGISKNPESFASYGYRMYFVDKARGMVMRLSRNGLESISAKGMQSYFYDKLNLSNRTIGTFDVRKGNYNLTLVEEYPETGDISSAIDTISYKEEVQGWPSRKSYIPESGLSLDSIYYTFKNGELYSHDNETRNTFYGSAVEKSSVKLILNSNPSEIKNYKTVNYEGDTGWACSSIITDQQNGDVQTFIEEEGKYYNFIKGVENSWNDTTQTGGLDTKEFSTQGIDTLQSITDSVGQTEVTITIKENND